MVTHLGSDGSLPSVLFAPMRVRPYKEKKTLGLKTSLLFGAVLE